MTYLALAIGPAQAVIVIPEVEGYNPDYIEIDGSIDASVGSCTGAVPCVDWKTQDTSPPRYAWIQDKFYNGDLDILSPDSHSDPGSDLPSNAGSRSLGCQSRGGETRWVRGDGGFISHLDSGNNCW